VGEAMSVVPRTLRFGSSRRVTPQDHGPIVYGGE